MNNIVIRDIAPRLTGQAHPLSSADKIHLIDSLTSAGVPAIEVSSFVRPDLIPGLADAEKVFAGIRRRPNVSLGCCVGNERGLRRAIDAGADSAYFLLSADETFAHNNIGKSTNESLRELERMNELASTSSITVGTYIIFAWGGPSGPPRRPADLLHLTRRLLDIGVEHWILADSCGYASPRAIRETTTFALEQLKDPNSLTVQIHDGRGMGLANIAELIKAGVTHIDTSLAGSGGHPAMPTTPGAGVCTEDVVQLLHLEGVSTGINLSALVELSNWFVDSHRIPSNGFVRIPGPVPTADLETNPPSDFAWRTA
ncbi:pyruvate carboxyltransferase [Rhodococcus sp. Eu-32]|uniref:pyruvate carboxyltransferase n=1 Tax=Rhodococcus sp. Eu-32 TaxID=1017319 RepID=UPI000DF312E7|nr:pyruvate carboxyltransferase [Rhodococcus sp. Eu-32]RRQ25534.1 pyruvate carboxyltransferase [Rhodococcus sp. Eu-32]